MDVETPAIDVDLRVPVGSGAAVSESLNDRLVALLNGVAAHRLSVEAAAAWVRELPLADLGFARVDHHRELRQGACEVVYGQGKSGSQVVAIVRRLLAHNSGSVIVTRAEPDHLAACHALAQELGLPVTEAPRSRALAFVRNATPSRGKVVILTAGTADLPVADEARLAAAALGTEVELHADVGVAGLHRLAAIQDQLRQADVLVVVAGMEGALASVVGGLVACPVIACPTSVGYGASFGGLAALLSMLSSCVPGVVSVNIDDGLGAGYTAALIARQSALARNSA
jgi:NCAIR mutase (PurE)-related protein